MPKKLAIVKIEADDLNRLRHLGGLMSDICWNISRGRVMDDGDKQRCEKLHRLWEKTNAVVYEQAKISRVKRKAPRHV